MNNEKGSRNVNVVCIKAIIYFDHSHLYLIFSSLFKG